MLVEMRTRKVVTKSKEMINKAIKHSMDVFEMNNRKEDLKMAMEAIDLMNESFELVIEQAKQMDEMQEKLDKIIGMLGEIRS